MPNKRSAATLAICVSGAAPVVAQFEVNRFVKEDGFLASLEMTENRGLSSRTTDCVKMSF
jgi:hypothetical protein